MKKLLPTTLVVASCALGLGLAAGSFAIANYAPAATDASDAAGHMFEMTERPTPNSTCFLRLARIDTGPPCHTTETSAELEWAIRSRRGRPQR